MLLGGGARIDRGARSDADRQGREIEVVSVFDVRGRNLPDRRGDDLLNESEIGQLTQLQDEIPVRERAQLLGQLLEGTAAIDETEQLVEIAG